ncbi:MAG: hypothetical protein K0S12_1551, partial [Bacteroidetes bacterium]|nr:hypothetical protein [Bacteroidota bacterium]
MNLKKLFYIFILLLAGRSFSQDSLLLKELHKKAKKAYSSEEYDSAIYYSQKLLSAAEGSSSSKYTIRAHYILGNVFLERNSPKEALENYFIALKLCKKLKTEGEYEGLILNHIAAVYFSQKNYKEAKSFFREEIALKESAGDSIKLANALINISSQYRRLNEFDSAALLLKRVRSIAFARNDSTLLGHFYNAWATYFFSRFLKVNNLLAGKGNMTWEDHYASESLRDSAELYWKRSLGIWTALHRPENIVNPLFNLGYAYQTKKDHHLALKNYLSAKQIVDSLQITGSKPALYGNLAEVYYDLGDYRNSANYLRTLLELKDSLQQHEIQNYSQKLAKQYQLETNRILVEQDLRLNLQKSEIAEQQKRIYLYVLLFIVLVLIIIGIIVYINFNKRVTKKVEEAKEKFFTNIMHEIRTPLSMIQAPLKTLRPKLQDEESLYYINLAEKNVVRLNELINQMLDVSKIDSATYKLNKTVGNLGLFFREMVANYEKLATEKDITFIAAITSDDALLVYDKDALEKIITNLLSNAIKYTKPKGSVGLNIHSEDKEDVSLLNIEVWDTGIGIPQA